MDWDCQDVVECARRIAASALNASVSPEHLLRAVVSTRQNTGARMLYHLKGGKSGLGSVRNMRLLRRRQWAHLPPLSADSVKCVGHARKLAKRLRNSYLGPEHLVVTLLAMKRYPLIAKLNRDGITYRRAWQLARTLLETPEPGRPVPLMRPLRAEDFPPGLRNHRKVKLLVSIYGLLDVKGLQGLPEAETARKMNPKNSEELARLAVDYLIWLHFSATVGRRHRMANVDWEHVE